MTSEGEVLHPERENGIDVPNRSLTGTPASAGVVEGRARVILRQEDARIEEGGILVTRFTDPGWTPLFLAVKGVVTEVGGQLTHGTVVAREYGLPAVVGVDDATSLIRDGERIRADDSRGLVERLG